ncbi:hypothetical protein TKK_0004433 [Trichogramma kaykai]|uniref:Death domain-containing protein n=1 Tax=Trichogramma kaykai TaxID=54128 RepID=A0ABD2XM46_9HYME
MSQDVQRCLRKLEIIRRRIDWEVRNERQMFINQLDDLIEAWTEQAVISKRQKTELELSIKLRDILEPKEIDEVIIDSLKSKSESVVRVLIQFAIETDYEDEPDFNEDAGPLVRRITPIHHSARGRSGLRRILIAELFQIYRRFDVNYIDVSGLTHFHVACMSGCDDAVEKFLEHNQDPNCVWRETGDSPLHLASAYGNMRIVHLLLRSGADPNLANKAGSTPLHVICRESLKGLKMAVWLFEASHEKYRPVQVDAQDEVGNTPLHLALHCGSKDLFEWLLRRITKPNLADVEGWTPLHVICDREDDESDKDEDKEDSSLSLRFNYELCLLKLFLDLHGDEVQVDARDRFGNTPLHLALVRRRLYAAELLLRRGADPNLANVERVTPLHLICQHDHTDRLVAKLFQICDARNQPVDVDAWDDKGALCRRWAMGFFLQLIHYRLPIIPCQMILDNLEDEDICNICVASCRKN